MIQVPEQFRPHIRVDYPPNNFKIFEEWFFDNAPDVILGDRHYLPIFWTSYYVNNNYGKDKSAISDLQKFIDSLDTSKKYFTILQYDDGILNNVNHLDLMIIGSGGGRIDYPISLLTMPHPYDFTDTRDIFCSFSGSKTHPLRNNLPGHIANNLPIYEYCRLMTRSVFALCPRGYGPSSFRICEAMQYGAIPVYISDRFIEPFWVDFNYYGIKAATGREAWKIINSMNHEQIKAKQIAVKHYYDEFYTYESTQWQILKHLSSGGTKGTRFTSL